MTPCENCKDRLLDYVFGLLEGSELEKTHEHLSVCSQCQAALAKAKSQQSLMGRAAKAVTTVAEFALPSPESTAPTIPMTIPVTAPQRSMWRRTWQAWSAAAAVLVAAGLSIAYYTYCDKVNGYQEVLASKRFEHNKLTNQFVSLPDRHELLQKTTLADLRARTGPHVHVVGPRTLQPGAKAHLHITTRHLEGNPAPSNLRIKLTEAESNKVVQVLRPQCDRDGQAIVELDAGSAKPGLLKLVIEAETGTGLTRVEEVLRLLDPTYVTRIDTNKIAYQMKDVLFFRVLALDRYSLQPPNQPIPMRVELVNAKGQAVRTLELPTGDGGILAREFAIDDMIQDGTYTLNVRPVDAVKTSVQPASQRVEIVRQLPTPESIVADKDRYLPGEEVTGVLRSARGTLPDRVKINGLMVPFSAEPDMAFAAPGGPPSPPMSKKTDAKGGKDAKGEKDAKDAKALDRAELLYRFKAGPLPTTLPPGARELRMVVPVQDGKKKTEIHGNIPIGPTDFTIDLFPEGGELIAGVQNRVFYRVRSKSGEPVTSEGKVLLMTGKDKIPLPDLDSSYEFGMGYLDFIPNPNEIYTICVTTPAKTEYLPNPFAKLGGIRSEGVVLQVVDPLGEEHAPKAVGNQGDPIRVTLRRQGPPRRLLVLVQCRGQIVDQRWVDVKQGAVDLTLHPTSDANGMIRVTAYELVENTLHGDALGALVGFPQVQTDKLLAGTLQPIAERLVYRGAPQLQLGFELNTQNYEPAKKMQAKITARDDKGQATAAWILASAVDERFQNRPRSLSAHFFLVNEVRTGADLDNAQLILHDAKDKESVQVLERFLGTHGWRRFLRAEECAVGLTPGNRHAQPLIFSRESMPLDAMQKQYEANIAKVEADIRAASALELESLETQRDQARDAVIAAASRLASFEASVQVGIHIVLRAAMVLLFGASLLLMGIGAYRTIRAHKTATPAFGASFACVAACLGLLLVNALIGPPSVSTTHIAERGPARWELGRELETRLARGPLVWGDRVETLQTGAFVGRVAKEADQAKVNETMKADTQKTKDSDDLGRHQLAQAFARRTRGENLAETEQRDRENRNAAKGAQPYYQLYGKMDAIVPAAVDELQKKAEVAATRKFAYEHEPDSFADTLLWHPSLWLENGSAEVRFDIGNGSQTYRVLLLGHSPTGRFGFYEKRLDVVGR